MSGPMCGPALDPRPKSWKHQTGGPCIVQSTHRPRAGRRETVTGCLGQIWSIQRQSSPHTSLLRSSPDCPRLYTLTLYAALACMRVLPMPLWLYIAVTAGSCTQLVSVTPRPVNCIVCPGSQYYLSLHVAHSTAHFCAPLSLWTSSTQRMGCLLTEDRSTTAPGRSLLRQASFLHSGHASGVLAFGPLHSLHPSVPLYFPPKALRGDRVRPPTGAWAFALSCWSCPAAPSVLLRPLVPPIHCTAVPVAPFTQPCSSIAHQCQSRCNAPVVAHQAWPGSSTGP